MSYYFSRVQLNAGRLDQAYLAQLGRHGEAYRDHALVWRLFPGDEMARDFIFRSESVESGGQVYYVVSQRPPQAQTDFFSIQTKPYAPHLAQGERLRFDLRANPTVSRHPEGQKAQRHDVLMDAKRKAAGSEQAKAAIEAAALQWLVRRGPDWGLRIDPDSVLTSAYTQHRLRHKAQRIDYSSLDYQGIAEVDDSRLLTRALLQGVGRARGFGCGLLLVKRLA